MTDHPTNQQATKYTITSAHRITGKSRTTIQKHLHRGKLTSTVDESGVRWIDASELIRAYGDACDFSREEGTQSAEQVSVTGVSDGVRTELHTLHEKLDTLVEERRRERGQLQTQIDHLQDALKLAQEGSNRALLLLENRSGGGEWREAVDRLEKRLQAAEVEGIAKAKAEARKELLTQPWWRVIWP